MKETARQLGREAAQEAIAAGRGLQATIAAWKRAAAPLRGFRFHDLRHQAITEMAEAGASDHTLMAMAGHMSRRMTEHYSHARMEAKRTVVDKMESGLMGGLRSGVNPKLRSQIEWLRHNPRHKPTQHGPRVLATY